MAKLPRNAPKPRSTSRPKLPSCPLGGAVKAALLKILPPGYCDPKSSSGTPGFTSRRYLMAVPVAKEYPPIATAGGGERGHFNIDSTSRQYWRIPPFTGRPVVICSSCTRKRFCSKMNAPGGPPLPRRLPLGGALLRAEQAGRNTTTVRRRADQSKIRQFGTCNSWWSNEPVRNQRE